MPIVDLRRRRAIPTVLTLWLMAASGCSRAPAPRAQCPTIPVVVEPSATHAAPGDAAVFPDATARLALFDALVVDIRRLHVFTPQTEINLGVRWDDQLRDLRAEAERASSPTELSVAMTHLASSLHNPHVFYSSSAHPRTITAGVEVDVEWIEGAPRFYVSKVMVPPPVGALAVGDIIEEADGIPAKDLLALHALESSANQWRGIAIGVARFLGQRRTGVSHVVVGERSSWRVRSRAGGETHTVELLWAADDGRTDEALEYKVDYDSASCAGLPDRAYGPGYRIVARGQNVCVYASTHPKWSAYPVVRHFSFDYGASTMSLMHQAVRGDHDVVARALGEIKGTRGVILDVRDNKGGNNPNWMLDWYATGPYVDRFVRTKLVSKDEVERALGLLELGGAKADAYRRAVAAAGPTDVLTPPRPFFCRPDGCDWDNRYEPKHRVTTAPVALLVGPGCVSSCDSLAQIFEDNRFGPLIGLPTSAGYTTQRIRLPVKLPSGQELGFFKLAFTSEVSGNGQRPIEAVSLHLDRLIERTFDNAAHYDELLVGAALEELQGRKTALR